MAGGRALFRDHGPLVFSSVDQRGRITYDGCAKKTGSIHCASIYNVHLQGGRTGLVLYVGDVDRVHSDTIYMDQCGIAFNDFNVGYLVFISEIQAGYERLAEICSRHADIDSRFSGSTGYWWPAFVRKK